MQALKFLEVGNKELDENKLKFGVKKRLFNMVKNIKRRFDK